MVAAKYVMSLMMGFRRRGLIVGGVVGAIALCFGAYWWQSSSKPSPINQSSNYRQYLLAQIAEPIAYSFHHSNIPTEHSLYLPVAEWSGRLIL
ncbi:MAG: hypothetical protein F6K16_38670, partial [Symploca sp. SIO2B6]|nr:hypothetical protein [Symploca sp. SIO2B6]